MKTTMEKRHTINTGLYSDFAVKLLNDLRKETMYVGRKNSINYMIYSIFDDVPDHVELYIPQEYGFQHVANGEVCLVDVELRPDRYYHWSFEHYTNKKYLELFALQIKKIVGIKIDEGDWRRNNFDVNVKINDNMYSIAELYFIFDFFFNHMKSINSFKKSYPEIVAKIIGSPRDPIITEFIQMAAKKKKDIYKQYLKDVNDLELNEVDYTPYTKVDREYAKKIKEIYDSFKVECELRKEALHKELLEEIAKCEIPKEMLVSNNNAI